MSWHPEPLLSSAVTVLCSLETSYPGLETDVFIPLHEFHSLSDILHADNSRWPFPSWWQHCRLSPVAICEPPKLVFSVHLCLVCGKCQPTQSKTPRCIKDTSPGRMVHSIITYTSPPREPHVAATSDGEEMAPFP